MTTDSLTTLDLDVLAPAGAVIKYKGQNINVPPLDVSDYSVLIELQRQMNGINNDNSDDPKVVMPMYEKMREFLDNLVPELKGEKLNLNQIMAVFNLITTANSPTDKAIEELKAQGIELKGGNTDPKGLTSSGRLPDSSDITPVTPSQTSPTAE